MVAAGPDDATAIGNLIVQLIAQGEINSVSEGRQIVNDSFEIKNYEPQEVGLWNEKYEYYLKMIRN